MFFSKLGFCEITYLCPAFRTIPNKFDDLKQKCCYEGKIPFRTKSRSSFKIEFSVETNHVNLWN